MNKFQILAVANTSMAIQAPASSGNPITLQPSAPSNPLQLWQAEIQTANGFTGIALVNPATGNSITFNGVGGPPLLTQQFSYGSTDEDAWYIVQGNNQGAFRFAYPPNNSLTFNDWGGNEAPGDIITLYTDQNPNSLWVIQIVN